VLGGTADLWDRQEGLNLSIILKVYATSVVGPTIVLPNHRASGSFRTSNPDIQGPLKVELLAKSWSLSFPNAGASDIRTHTVESGDNQILIHGPGFFRIHGQAQSMVPPSDVNIDVSFSLRPAGVDAAASVQATLVPWDKKLEGVFPPPVARWRIKGGESE
jgi:hypothetical protein